MTWAGNLGLAETGGETSNSDFTELFDVLAEWEAVLQAQNIDFTQLSRPTEPEIADIEPEPQL